MHNKLGQMFQYHAISYSANASSMMIILLKALNLTIYNRSRVHSTLCPATDKMVAMHFCLVKSEGEYLYVNIA